MQYITTFLHKIQSNMQVFKGLKSGFGFKGTRRWF